MRVVEEHGEEKRGEGGKVKQESEKEKKREHASSVFVNEGGSGHVTKL